MARRQKTLIIFFLLSMGWIPIQISAGDCFITAKPPQFPKVGLGFCSNVFPFENCCVPAFDEEIRGYYDGLIQTSDLCGSLSTESTRALQFVFCFACSDQQPRYFVNEGLQSDNTTLYSIVLCESLVRLLYPENFDDCGFIVPTARGDDCAGDGTVRPSDHWGSGEAGALEFLNDETGGKPPLFANDDETTFRVIIDYSNGDSCYKSSGYRLLGSSQIIWLVPILVSIIMIVIS